MKTSKNNSETTKDQSTATKALVTGASSGIGAIYADRLARRGYDLVLVARNTARLTNVAERIRCESGRKVEVVTADLSQPADLHRVEELLRQDAGIDVLVNNAGVGGVKPLLQSDSNTVERMIDLNVIALTRLTYAAAPQFVRRGRGTIINISSIVAIAPELLNGVYGGTKAFVLAFTQSLRHELRDKGVRVQAVLPGATATEFWDIAGLSHDHLPSGIVMKSEDMVDASLVGLDSGEVITIPPLQDGSEWDRFEALRRDLSQKLGNSKPGIRYALRTKNCAVAAMPAGHAEARNKAFHEQANPLG